ncbi:TPA: ead/Ea22-like family protein [Yersinia enterocolitica]
MNNIEELKKVALAATPGPWEKCDSYGPNENGTCISAVERPDLMIASTTGYYGRVGGIANTHFIALANPAVILDLIAQLEAAQKEIHDLKMKLSDAGCLLVEWKHRVEQSEYTANKAEAALSAANEKPIQITLGAGDVMISHIKWPDAQGISFAPMPTGYTGIGLNIDEQVSGKNSGEIGANVIIKSSSIESLKVLRDIVLIAIAGFTVEGE